MSFLCVTNARASSSTVWMCDCTTFLRWLHSMSRHNIHPTAAWRAITVSVTQWGIIIWLTAGDVCFSPVASVLQLCLGACACGHMKCARACVRLLFLRECDPFCHYTIGASSGSLINVQPWNEMTCWILKEQHHVSTLHSSYVLMGLEDFYFLQITCIHTF